jgi:leucyl aminopeptidase
VAITFAQSNKAPEKVEADLLAVPIFRGDELSASAAAIDRALGGRLAAFLRETGFEGKLGETVAIPVNGTLAAQAAVLVGLGDRDKVTLDGIRRVGGAIARRAAKAQLVATSFLGELPEHIERSAAAQALAEGVVLGAYQFLKYKREPKPSSLAKVVVLGKGGRTVQSALTRGSAVARAACWARDLVNEPAGSLTPTDLAAAAKAMAKTAGLKIKVLDETQIANERLGGLLGVAQGSVQPPRLIRLDYVPPKARATVALVGKGITFDSGGLSLKTSDGMETMKTDMSGAAAVLATMSVLKELGVKVRVTGIVPTTENMPGGRAIKPGDVLKIRNGKTVEVLNTDAEGRLILADGLSLASEEKPDAIVDIATLTGACVVALGDKVGGILGNDDDLIDQVREASGRSGEPMWPLPLPDDYRKSLDSEIADLRNVTANRGAGALTAGLFLKEFVDDVPWAHLDIAGPARAGSDDGYLVKGGTGFAVRTLVELIAGFRRPGK